MINIKPVSALTDNYIWLLQHDQQAVVIDPGEAAPVLDYLATRQLQLSSIWLTHTHADHIGGVSDLKKAYPQCRVYGNDHWAGVDEAVNEGSLLTYGNQKVKVWHIPGHTTDHLAYLLQDSTNPIQVFCGDTLFSAGCGRVFTGTMAQLYDSLQRLVSLPEDTLFYPAHELTAANLLFAQAVEPHNPDIKQAMQKASVIPTLPVSLAHELRVNPFLRLKQPEVIAAVLAQGLTAEDAKQPLAVFTCLREWKNRF